MSGHFEDTLATFACLDGEILDARRKAYVKALQDHDWAYEFCENKIAWARGRSERMLLRILRDELDVTWKLWDQYAPMSCRSAGNKR